MPRRTPTLELVQNTDVSSPIRRSSRIAQNQKSSAHVVTRRASAETETTTITSETRKSRRLSLSQEPREDLESEASTPVFVNNESKTPSARKRKDSTSSISEGKTVTSAKRTLTPLTRRSTRSMSRSPQKSEETAEPTSKCKPRHLSVTEKLKPLEAIKEMEAVKESIQHDDHDDDKENKEVDEYDKEVEKISTNSKKPIVMLSPFIKKSSLDKLNLSNKQLETQEVPEKDANVINIIKENENKVVLEENSINEVDTTKCKILNQNSENNQVEENKILDTSTTEKSENEAGDNLIENKIDENLSKSVVIETVENDFMKSSKKLETAGSNGKSTNELILSSISPVKNRNIDSNLSFSDDKSFQFNLNVTIDNILKTPEKKGKENKLNTSSCGQENQQNEQPLLNTSKVENSKETTQYIASKLNKTKTPEQSPKYEKYPVGFENSTLAQQDSLCEPMDVDEYSLLGDLDDNVALKLSTNLPSTELKQIDHDGCLTSPAKNEKCLQNIDNSIEKKENTDVVNTSRDKEHQIETEKFSQDILIIESETTKNVQAERKYLNEDNLKNISLVPQTDATSTTCSSVWISETEIENEKERNQSIHHQIKSMVFNEKTNTADNCATSDDKNYDLKNNGKNEGLPVEKINLDKEKGHLNQSRNVDDEKEVCNISPFKNKTTKKITELHVVSPRLNIDVQLENKVTDLINNKFNVNQEKSDSEVDAESVTDYLDNIAEEDNEDESENNSNEIIDEGESIGFSSSDEKETDCDDSFDDSFIDDDVSSELLSGKEYDLNDDNTKNRKQVKTKRKKMQKENEKWSRIIQVDESDESLIETANEHATNSISMSNKKEQSLLQHTFETPFTVDEQVVETNSALDKSIECQSTKANESEFIVTSEEQADKIETSPKKTKKRSSLTISENLSFDEIRERIEQVVDLFSSTVNKNNRKIYLNLSLNYESDSDSKENESKLSTSLQVVNPNKRKKSTTRPKEFEFLIDHQRNSTNIERNQNEAIEQKDDNVSVNNFQSCKPDEIIEETGKEPNINVEETLLSSPNNSKNRFREENENLKSTEKIFNDDLVISNPPKKKKKVECSEERFTLLDNNKVCFEENSQIRKNIKKLNEDETTDHEDSNVQSHLINEYTTNNVSTIIKKKDKKKKKQTKEKELENVDTKTHKKKRKSAINEIEILAGSLKKTKKQKMSTENEFENTKIGDNKEKNKVKILSNVLINTNEKTGDQIKKPKEKHEINFTESNIMLPTKEKGKQKKERKTEESSNTYLNIIPSKSNPKLWIVDHFDTPPRPSQNRKLKLKRKNNSKEFNIPAAKDFKNIKLYDSSRINRMETAQLLKKKKKLLDIKTA